LEFVAGGSVAETVGGAGAVVLAILALAGILPAYLAAIATIAVGAALLFEGAAVAGRYRDLLKRVSENEIEATELGGGVSAEALGGLAGIALGILALLGVAPMALMSVAMIVLGGALLLSAGTTARLNDLHLRRTTSDTVRMIARDAVSTAAGTQVLAGAAGIVLGILALQGLASVVLIDVAALSLGASVLLTGTALGGKMMAALTG